MKLMGIFAVLLFLTSASADDGFVSFTDVSPYSSMAEIMRRMGTPADYQSVVDRLASQGQRLAEQPIDPTKEQFFLHVPPEMPPGGYGLLVWVWPFEQGFLPRGWGKYLDRHGVIFVAAAHSGNSERIESRRAPLALLGAINVMKRYQINPDHLFVGGISGGSRVAERLALAYPDLFRGAFMNAGADPLSDLTMPPPDLFSRFLETSHLVVITGQLDRFNLAEDVKSRSSFDRLCMFRVDSYQVPNLDHAVLPPEGFEWGLRALFDPPPPDNEKLAACRAAAH